MKWQSQYKETRRTVKRFAFFPVRLHSLDWIWFEFYFEDQERFEVNMWTMPGQTRAYTFKAVKRYQHETR